MDKNLKLNQRYDNDDFVRVPHDGTLHAIYNKIILKSHAVNDQNQSENVDIDEASKISWPFGEDGEMNDNNNSNENGVSWCVGQREALKLVFLRYSGKNVFNDDCKSLIEIEINKFLCVLIPPKQRKERREGRENEQKNFNVSSSPSSLQKQLRAIQSFRSFILSMEHPTEMEDGDNNVLEGKTKEYPKRKEVMIGLYRILFELSLSCYTPAKTMRRALFSLLSAIQQKNPRGDDDCLFFGWKEVQLSVIQSLIGEEIRSSNKHQKSYWNDQMNTLHAFWSTFNLLLPNKTKNNTIHHDISGENIDENESEKLKMIDSSLRLLLEEGSSKMLATVSSSKPQGLIVGVNICSIMNLILPHLHYFEGRTIISDLSSSVRTKITTLFTDIVEPFFLNFLQYYDKCSHSYNLINELNTVAIVFSKMNLFLFHHFNYNRTLNNNDNVVTTPISLKSTKGVSSEEDSTDYIKSLFEYYIHHHNPHPLIQLALVRGMISLFYNNSITKEKKTTLHTVEPFYNHTLHIIQKSASIEFYDAHVLHQAFKCMDYILSCIKEMPSETSSLEKKEHHLNFIIQTLFPIILNSWQTIHSSNSTSVTHQTNNNSNKAISHILPVLFEKLAKMAHLKSTMTTPYTPNNDTTLITQQQSHECFHFIPTDLSSFGREKTISLEYIVHVILSLPPNQKGRYIALEVLLPLLGAKKLLKIIDSFSSSSSTSTGDKKCHHPHLFVYNLLYNIGGDIYGNNKNSGVILNVLKKLLIQYKQEEEECLGENSKSSSNCKVGQYENRKARKRRLRKEKQLQREREREKEKESFTSDKNNKRKLEQLSSCDDSNQREKEIEISSFLKLPITWSDLWTTPLKEILLSPSIIFRRKIQIVSFVFPMLATLSGTSNNHQIPLIYSALLEKLFDKKINDPGISQSHFIWAVLELIQQYSKLNNGFMESLLLVASQARQSKSSHDQCHIFLLQTIQKVMSVSQLQQALVHKNEKIRVVAFSCINPVIFAHSFQRGENLSFYYLRMEELKLWKASFHYAMNNNSNSGSSSNNSGNGNNSSKDGKIYCVQIMTQLTKFLQSLLDLIVSTKNKKEEVTLVVKRFICDFLIRDIIILKGLYPNTVQEKEKFALNLLETLFTFICVNIGIDQLSFQAKKKHMRSTCVESVSIISSTVFNTNVPSNKKRRKGYTKEIQNFLHDHVFLPLFGFDHAFITPPQSTASNEIDTDLVNQDKDTTTMAQPLCYALLQILLNSPWDSSREHAYRLLKQIITAQTSKDVPKDSVNRNEIEYFYARGFHLASSPRQRESDAGARMLALVSIFSSSVSEANHEKRLQYELKLRLDGMHQYLEQNESISKKNALPLAHGVFQAIRLYYSHLYQKSTHDFFNNQKDSVVQYVEFCCNAIELALGLVGDYKGDDSSSTTSRSIPLNLNASTIGANAPFADTSKSKAESKSDETQRVIMGSWLLTREAMKTLSTIICISDVISYEIIANAGILLLKTLTSMKHQGTSFTAHESLQQICDACFCSQREELSELPLQFMKDFLFREITRMEEIVHDSTLRRSTGYALGFLCIMRSLSSSKKKEKQNIITSTLAKLVKLSLPTNHEKSFFIYPKHLASAPDEIIEQTSFSWKTRVHALNILRACILDAPLSEYTTIFVGDAIISSMLGSDMDYGSSFDEKEKCWNIQNSSSKCLQTSFAYIHLL